MTTTEEHVMPPGGIKKKGTNAEQNRKKIKKRRNKTWPWQSACSVLRRVVSLPEFLRKTCFLVYYFHSRKLESFAQLSLQTGIFLSLDFPVLHFHYVNPVVQREITKQ